MLLARLIWFSGVCGMVLTGCGIPPVDTATISQTPASQRDFLVAKRAVQACANLPSTGKVLTAFRRAGFQVSEKTEEVSRKRSLTRPIIKAPSERVSVLYFRGKCFVGLEGMTPQQSYELASIWARAYDALPNSSFGDGLSDHVVGAWRRFFEEPAEIPVKAPHDHRIYITAYKTWPTGPYDPQRNFAFNIDGIFPDTPGAEVRLSYTRECKPIQKTGKRSGVFLPCLLEL